MHRNTLFNGLLLLLGPVLFLLILIMPGPSDMSPQAQKVTAVAVWMASWWLTDILPIGATALLPFVLFPFLGVMTSSEALSSFAEDVVFLMMGGFMLAAAMERWNLHRRIALFVIDHLGATPRRIVLGFMLATAFLSLWISNTSTTLMMLPIATAVLVKLRELSDEDTTKTLAPALVLSIAYSASIGGVGTLIGTPPNAIFVGQAHKLFAQQISFYDWLRVGIPFVLLMLPLTWLFLVRFLFPLPNAISRVGREIIKGERNLLGRPGRGEICVALVFIVTALGWIFRKDIAIGEFMIPGIARIFPSLTSDATLALGAAALLFAIPVDLEKKLFVLDMKTALRIPWDILLIFAGGFCLANGFIISGLSDWLAGRMSFFSHLHPYIVLLICVALVTFLTEITSNAATASVFTPIAASLALSIGQHPYFLMIPCTLAVSMAFMLPVATPPNAIVFGSNYVSIRQMARAGIGLNIIAIVLITILFITLIAPLIGIHINTVPDWARVTLNP